MPPRNNQKRSYPSHHASGSSSSSSSGNPAFPVYNPLAPLHQHQRSPSPPSSSAGAGLAIQAYELSLIRGRVDEGREMEERRVDLSEGRGRGRLLKWDGRAEGEGEVWVDRFSHLHLLPTGLPPPPPRHTPHPPPSPGASEGWSELPSDTEDTFFFSEDEAEDYERDKKRRRLDGLRGGRLAALGGPEKNDEKEKVEEVEETVPPLAILTLMRHTSSALLSSPSPRVLELRILANHGADPRFGFMRGKWKLTWDALLAGEKVDDEGKVVVVEEGVKGIGGLLGGYGSDSGSESGSDGHGEGKADGAAEEVVEVEEVVEKEEPEAAEEETEEEKEEKKRRRKEKALEWAKKRKAVADSEGGAAVPAPPPPSDLPAPPTSLHPPPSADVLPSSVDP